MILKLSSLYFFFRELIKKNKKKSKSFSLKYFFVNFYFFFNDFLHLNNPTKKYFLH